MNFYNRIYLLLITLFLVSCDPSKFKDTDDLVFNEELLVGTWSQNEVTPHGFYLSVVTFTPDGMKCTLGTSYNKENQYDKSLFISKWKLSGKKVDVTIIKTSTPLLVVGETLSVEIISFTKSEIKSRLLPTEQAFINPPTDTLIKLSNIPDLTVCETADELLQH